MISSLRLSLLLLAAGCASPVADPAPNVPAELRAAALRVPSSSVAVDTAANTVTVYFGPFAVPAADPAMANMPHDMVGHQSPLMEFSWPVDGWFRGYRLLLVDAEGHPLPREVMHHLVGYNLERPQLLHPGVERLFGVGRETGDIVLPAAIGVPVTKGSRLAVNVAWHNETGKELPAVYLRLVLPYTPKGDGKTPIEALPFHAEVNYQISGTTAFDLPPGKSAHQFEFVMPVDGGIIGISGHLHDYGTALRLEDSSGAVLFTLPVTRDSAGHVLGIKQRIFRNWFGLRDARVPLLAGHRYRVVGEYDNPTGKTIAADAMAHVAGLIAPTDLARWPKLDLTDPLVQEDLRVLRGEAMPEVMGAMPGMPGMAAPHKH